MPTTVERLTAIKDELLRVYSEAAFAADYPAQLIALDLLARVRAFLNQREAAPNGNAEGRS